MLLADKGSVSIHLQNSHFKWKNLQGDSLKSYLLKLARFCITLAMSVSVRDVRSAGYSCIRLNSEGDMMAGHMKRRNREELMRLSARSSLPRSALLALQEAKTSFSSRGKMLKRVWVFFFIIYFITTTVKTATQNARRRKITTLQRLPCNVSFKERS